MESEMLRRNSGVRWEDHHVEESASLRKTKRKRSSLDVTVSPFDSARKRRSSRVGSIGENLDRLSARRKSDGNLRSKNVLSDSARKDLTSAMNTSNRENPVSSCKDSGKDFEKRIKRKHSIPSRAYNSLQSETMEEEKFYQWLEDNNLQRFKQYFRSDSGELFEKGLRKNSIGVSSATIEELFQILFLPQYAALFKFFDREVFVKEFICCYLLFATPEEVFARIKENYTNIPFSISGLDIDQKNTYLFFLEEWIQVDFHRSFSKELQQDVNKFLNGIKLEMPVISSKIRCLTELVRKKMIPEESLVPTEITSVLDINTKEIARQLTLQEQLLFKCVSRLEILNGIYNKEKSPNIAILLKHQRKIDNWVRTEILRRGDSNSRSILISYFIRVAQELYLIKNYSTLTQIILALDSFEIQKLKRSWSEESAKGFHSLKSFIYDDRYNAYLCEIESIDSETCFLPLISYACEMTMKLHEVLDSYDGDKINWRKIKSHANIIEKAGLLRDIPLYTFDVVHPICSYIEQAEVWENEELRWIIASALEKKDFNFIANTQDLWKKTRELDATDWEALYLNANKIKYKPGETIIHQNAEVRRIYQIKSGTVAMMKDGEIVKQIGENVFIGLDSYLHPTEVNHSNFKYVAFNECTLHKFKPSDLFGLMDEHPKALKMLNQWIGLQLVTDFDDIVPQFSRRNQISKFERAFDISDEAILYETPCKFKHKTHRSSGLLMCTQNYLSYISKDFGRKFQFIRPYEDIKLTETKDEDKFSIMFKDVEPHSYYKITIKSKDLEAHQQVRSIWKQKKHKNRKNSEGDPGAIFILGQSQEILSGVEHKLSFSDEEWSKIIEGNEFTLFNNGDIVIQEGDTSKRLFYIAQGKCAVYYKGERFIDLYDGDTLGKIVLLLIFSQ
eukprot:TRINITY_DN421_c0_g1_i5.p1 TRINITY_DN421_c0_g1~~TRINITY_DN421_c0_g1_i5.p1  ORF type:complete len:903 (-),score=155.19 TRINITY_DN421_c0_g1_i5:348-3056(-)